MIVKKKRSSSANGREKNWSRFRVVLTKEMQGGNINAFMKDCGRKYKLNT